MSAKEIKEMRDLYKRVTGEGGSIEDLRFTIITGVLKGHPNLAKRVKKFLEEC